jgi:heme exporter protein D
MNWPSWSAFWAMGGHGFFVWGTYAVALVLLVAEPLLVAVCLRRARAAARQAHDEEGGA